MEEGGDGVVGGPHVQVGLIFSNLVLLPTNLRVQLMFSNFPQE